MQILPQICDATSSSAQDSSGFGGNFMSSMRSAARLLGVVPAGDFLFVFGMTRQKLDGATTLAVIFWWNNSWQAQKKFDPPAGYVWDLDHTYQGTVSVVAPYMAVYACATNKTDSTKRMVRCYVWTGGANWQSYDLTNPPGKTIDSVDYAMSAPTAGVFVKATDGSYWFGLAAGTQWAWSAAAVGKQFIGSTNTTLISTFQTRSTRFLIQDVNPNDPGNPFPGFFYDNSIQNALRARYAVVTYIADSTMLQNPKISIRGRNPDGFQYETEFSNPNKLSKTRGTLAFCFDLSLFTYFRPGADCWVVCSEGNHESSTNFTYDPSYATNCAYYELDQQRGMANPSFTDVRPTVLAETVVDRPA